MDKVYDSIIIGAGYAGLSAAALLSQNENVLLIESHYTIGGCAGFYKKNGFTFDVGATTLSGVDHNGPISKLKDILNLKTVMNSLDEPMRLRFKDSTEIVRHKDHNKWIEELNRVFPEIDHSFWDNFSKINKKAWEFLSGISHPPFFSTKGIIEILSQSKKSISLLPYLITPLEKYIPDNALKDKKYVELLNEQLMISTQTTLDKAPALIGILGLCYPEDCWYMPGGITSLGNDLKEVIIKNNSEIKLRTKIISLKKEDNIFILEDEKNNIFKSKKVISTIPIWNLGPLTGNNKIQEKANQFKDAWGAVTANFVVKFKTPPKQLYHQVHFEEMNHTSSESFFFSLSSPDDNKRNKDGYQTVTASTHTKRELFPKERDLDYKTIKSYLESRIIALFKESFEKYEIEDIKHVEIGTPLTFEHYTNRYEGRVGGIPHHYRTPPFLWPQFKSPIKNLFLIGDTTFPGQGIVGVIQGSLNLYNYLYK